MYLLNKYLHCLNKYADTLTEKPVMQVESIHKVSVCEQRKEDCCTELSARHSSLICRVT